MSETKHTPGPWAFESFSFGSPDALISHKKIVGPPYGPHGARNLIAEVHMQHETHEADGRLIAAAPELLEALEVANVEMIGLAAYLSTCAPSVIIDNLETTVAALKAKQKTVDAAIRKAEGE